MRDDAVGGADVHHAGLHGHFDGSEGTLGRAVHLRPRSPAILRAAMVSGDHATSLTSIHDLLDEMPHLGVARTASHAKHT